MGNFNVGKTIQFWDLDGEELLIGIKTDSRFDSVLFGVQMETIIALDELQVVGVSV